MRKRQQKISDNDIGSMARRCWKNTQDKKTLLSFSHPAYPYGWLAFKVYFKSFSPWKSDNFSFLSSLRILLSFIKPCKIGVTVSQKMSSLPNWIGLNWLISVEYRENPQNEMTILFVFHFKRVLLRTRNQLWQLSIHILCSKSKNFFSYKNSHDIFVSIMK